VRTRYTKSDPRLFPSEVVIVTILQKPIAHIYESSMADHLSALGFSVESVDAFEDLIAVAMEESGEVHPSPHGSYVRCPCGPEGPELWVQADEANALGGCQPHFSGAGALTLEGVEPFADPEYALEGWAIGRLGDFGEVAVQVVDFDAWRARFGRDPSSSVTFQIAAFAEALTVYAHAGEFEGADDEELSIGDFIPMDERDTTGAITRAGSLHARVSFAAPVDELTYMRNEWSFGRYYHAVVTIAEGATIDVMIPSRMMQKRPRPGLMLAGDFWLSAREVRP